MRAAAIRRDIRKRFHHLPTWIGLLGYGTFFGFIPLLFGGWRSVTVANLTLAYWLSCCYGLLSSIPWLWTGDDRLWAGHGRGLLQALAGHVLLTGTTGAVFLAWQGWREIRPFLPYLPLHVAGLTLVGYFIALGVRTETHRDESLQEARQARFQLLQAQLSPHFLFNALSAFAELGRRDWPATEQGLLDLAQVYRGLLELGERSEATLGEERALLEAMLSVESLRLGDRLQVAWAWDAGLDGFRAPPLLLLPLVENAVKHGLSPSAEGGQLRISASRAAGRVVLEVANTGAWKEAPPASGQPGASVGLRNLEARLRLAFGSAAQFSLSRQDGWTRARLDLPEGP